MAARVTRQKVGEQEEEVATPSVVEPEVAVPPAEVEDGGGVDEEEDVELDDDSDENSPLMLEDMDPNLPLWDDGPTVTEALAYKEEYGEIYITSASLTDHYLWRPLVRSEYRSIMRQVEELTNSNAISQSDVAMTQEELITEICLLSPKLTLAEFGGKLAGIPSLLSQQILEMSGFIAIDTRGL